VSTTALAGFPTDGSSFGVLTSGNVNSVGSPGTFANANDGGGNVRGNTDLDVSILEIDLSVPSTANCLTFDFRFLSEEFPGYVNSQYNDAFIAELDSSTWTTSARRSAHRNNFAFDSSHNVVSVNSTGIGGMSAANGTGTAFNGGTTYAANGFARRGPAGGRPCSCKPPTRSRRSALALPLDLRSGRPLPRLGGLPRQPRRRLRSEPRREMRPWGATRGPADHATGKSVSGHRRDHLQRAGGDVHRSGHDARPRASTRHDRLGRRDSATAGTITGSGARSP
jgi:hypothetical protein